MKVGDVVRYVGGATSVQGKIGRVVQGPADVVYPESWVWVDFGEKPLWRMDPDRSTVWSVGHETSLEVVYKSDDPT